MDGLILLVGIPVAFALAAWAGRSFMWRHWKMDLPYDERLRAFGLR